MNETIFISFPSLYDTELIPSVIGFFEKAANPNRVFIGVSITDTDDKIKKDFIEATQKYASNIRVEFKRVTIKSAKKLMGVGIGRKRAHDLYNGEDYFLQTDAHAFSAKNWDSRLVDLHKRAKEHVKNDKVILTGYGGVYTFKKNGERYFITKDDSKPVYQGRIQYPFFSDRMYYGKIPGWDLISEEELNKLVYGEFAPAIKFNANFTFGDKEFANNTGLMDNFSFFEEEVIQTCELVKAGFTLVYPTTKDPLIGHMYSDFWVGDYGYRKVLSDYFPELSQYFTDLAIDNYRAYMNDPANKDHIKKYTLYAKIHPFYGSIYSKPYVPNYYINSEVKYARKF